MTRLLLRILLSLLVAAVLSPPRFVLGNGCPICGPPGQAWFDLSGPNKSLQVQGPPDTLTCFDLYEIFEEQTRNYRIGEYSCNWAKWTATQYCDCQGQLWDWPDVIQNDVCDACGQLLDPGRESQPTGFFGQTCSAIIVGGFGRTWDTAQCQQAKQVMDEQCGCSESTGFAGGGPPPTTSRPRATSPPTPAPEATPPMTPSPITMAPTPSPISSSPSTVPSTVPSIIPSSSPSQAPSVLPSQVPSSLPSLGPSTAPVDPVVATNFNPLGTTSGVMSASRVVWGRVLLLVAPVVLLMGGQNLVL